MHLATDKTETGLGRRLPALDTAWCRYVLFGLVATLVTAFSHRWWGVWGSTVTQLTTGVAVVVGIRRFTPARPGFWWLLAAGQLTYAVAQAYWRIKFDGWKPDIPFRSVDDALYFVAFGLFIAALARRALSGVRRGQRRANIIDGLVVVLGLSSGTWKFIAEPFLLTHRLDPTGTALFWTYEAMELGRMAFLAMIVLSGTVRNGAQRLIVAGVLLQLTGDLAYSVGMPAAVNPADGWQNAAWLLGSIVVGAAALHPDMAADDRRAHDAGAISGRRLGVFVLLTIVSPVMTGLDAVFGDRSVPLDRSSATLGGWVPMVLGVLVSALLVVRMGLLAGVAQRRAAQLDAALREQEALRAQLEHRATHDPLTGLGNRALLIDTLTAALDRPAAERGWLLLLDLDGFKAVNDTLGHPAGDQLLVVFADRLRAAVPDGTVTRLGGDEFAILLGRCGSRPATTVADDILVAAAQDIALSGHPVRVSASIGLLDLGAVTDASVALKDADVALYAAKMGGKNRHLVFGPALRGAPPGAAPGSRAPGLVNAG